MMQKYRGQNLQLGWKSYLQISGIISKQIESSNSLYDMYKSFNAIQNKFDTFDGDKTEISLKIS